MRTYRVHAEFKCNCDKCKGEGLANEEILFSDDFKARDGPDAENLAKAKFNMILDDIVSEFKDEGHKPFLNILGYEEI